MSADEPRLQPGVTPEHHALLAEALAAAKAYPGGPEAMARMIGRALAAAPPLPEEQAAARHAFEAECQEPEAGL